MEMEKKTIEMYDPQGVYNEGGKGRKQCACGKFVGARVKECPACKHVFISAATTTTTSATVAPNTSAAPPVEKRKRVPKEAVEPVARVHGERTIYTPGGLCPVHLAGMKPNFGNPKNEPASAQDVKDWADKLVGIGQATGIRYMPSAIKYYLRHFYDIYSPLWYEATAALDEWIMANMMGQEVMEVQNAD